MPPRNTPDMEPSLAPELSQAIRAVIWFEAPETAVNQPSRLLCYAMQYASEPSFSVIRKYFDDEAFRNALRHAPAGILDRKSWAFWHAFLKPYGNANAPPLPHRPLE
jgi:hypothetical protein